MIAQKLVVVTKAGWRGADQAPPALTPTMGANQMVEAIPSLTPSRAQRQADRARRAVRIEALRRARTEVKAAIQREGRIKLSSLPARDITAMAETRLVEDAAFRAKLIAEAKAVVEQRQWGPRGGLRIT
jgi:hypothetical protein